MGRMNEHLRALEAEVLRLSREVADLGDDLDFAHDDLKQAIETLNDYRAAMRVGG